MNRKTRLALGITAAVLALAAVLFWTLGRKGQAPAPESTVSPEAVASSASESTVSPEAVASRAPADRLILDGEPWEGGVLRPESTGSLRVYITLDGKDVAVLPFEEAHVLRIETKDGGMNTVTMTGTSVSVTEADCSGQDCVGMGEVTAENLETRVLGGFIVCLPHRLAVEVRGR